MSPTKYRRPTRITYRWTSWKKDRARSQRIKTRRPSVKPIQLVGKKTRRKPATFKIPKPEKMIIHRRGGRSGREGVNLEYRAKQGVKGTLPERILYKSLELRGWVAGVDFDFQSSLQGGRLELGGILADFMFPRLRLIIQVQGPTHSQYLRFRKDEEQKDALSEKGFSVLEVDDDVCLDFSALDQWLRRNLDVIRGGVGATFRTL